MGKMKCIHTLVLMRRLIILNKKLLLNIKYLDAICITYILATCMLNFYHLKIIQIERKLTRKVHYRLYLKEKMVGKKFIFCFKITNNMN